ncbi:hypothetical protein L7F22_059491 [Adiantum nelumboides]|nr:hypothetical protein [Adiantum nelumboides]
MSDEAWVRQNRKAVQSFCETFQINDCLICHGHFDVWQKLNAVYEKTTPINQVHLMQKLVGMQLDESKSAAEHLSLFTSILSQLQDSGLPPFDDKLKAIFLLMTLPDSWETLVVSLSNNPNLTFNGVRGSILNEKIRRKASGEGGSSANMVRGRTENKNAYAQRSKSKSKERGNAQGCFRTPSRFRDSHLGVQVLRRADDEYNYQGFEAPHWNWHHQTLWGCEAVPPALRDALILEYFPPGSTASSQSDGARAAATTAEDALQDALLGDIGGSASALPSFAGTSRKRARVSQAEDEGASASATSTGG